MDKELKKILKEVAYVAKLTVKAGWGEATSGNFSVNVSDFVGSDLQDFKMTSEKITPSKQYPELAGQALLISLSGSRMRMLAKNPKKSLGLLQFSQDASTFNLYQFKDSDLSEIKPSSEIPTHLLVQQKLKKENHPDKVLLHVHMTEAIVISHFKEMLDEDKLNHTLWSMLPEIAMFLPQGTGFIPYRKPGSAAIGQKTAEKVSVFDTVIWEKHGSLAVGESPEDAFDKLEMLAKAINIYLECRKAGINPEGLSKDDITALRK